MTLGSSLSSSIADVNEWYHNKRLPKGVHIVGTDGKSAPKGEEVSDTQKTELPWGYLFIPHFAVEKFEKTLQFIRESQGGWVPKCFIHRTQTYKRKPSGKGVTKEEKPSVSGLVFLQGETKELKVFLQDNFPQYHLVNDCMTGKSASIPHRIMRPFMRIVDSDPERVTFLRDPFIKFAKDHVKLRVLTGVLKGQEGYIIRILRDRQLVMDMGGYAVAISNVYREDFEIAE